jgi:hypothetical protein
LTRLGCVAWATGGTAGVKQLADGRKIGIRLGCDLLGLFDILAVDPACDALVRAGKPLPQGVATFSVAVREDGA